MSELDALLDALVERVAERVVERLCKRGVQVVQPPVQPVCNAPGTDLALDLNSPTESSYYLETIPGHSVRGGCAFERWWSIYPRKVNKKRAREIWAKRKLDTIGEILIKALEVQVAEHGQWRDKDDPSEFALEFVPHPTTYLNGDRWNDDIEPIRRTESPSERVRRVNGIASLGESDGHLRSPVDADLRRPALPGVAERVRADDARAGDGGPDGLSWLR